MSLNRAVSTVQVRVDEFELGIKAGSLTYKEGFATRTVTGLDNGDVIASESREDAKGMIKFEMPPTKDNIKTVRSIEQRAVVTVKFFDDNGTERVMAQGVSLNDSEKSIGSDGTLELNFEGTPLV